MEKIAIIPARSGSKGLPHKNILNLYGKPLLAWSIEAALKSEQFSRVIVSTDSVQYGKISEKYGAEVFYRDENVSNDKASTYDVIKDLFEKMDVSALDYFVLLQPTSPLRNEKHIIEAIHLFENNYKTVNTLVSVSEAHKSSDLIKPIDESLSLKYFDKDFSDYKRQEYKEYEPNGAIFISKIESYLKVKHFFGKQGIAYIMNPDDSIDIDGRNDFELAINILIRRNKRKEIEKLVKKRIKEKNILETSIQYPLTLIGHSFFDEWQVQSICGMKINNLGVNGSTAELYKKEILDNLKCTTLGDYIIVMFGINEISFEDDIALITQKINDCLEKIYSFNPRKVFFVNITNVNGRIDRNNDLIDKCKDAFVQYLKADKIISIDFLNDEYGWLDERYTDDGLHLNKKGYQIFLDIIEGEIKDEI